MTQQARGTLARSEKGPVAAPPSLPGHLGRVVDAVSAWPGVATTVHWHFADHTRVDGVDFYVGEAELGHLHLDGSIHLATPPSLGDALVAQGAARPFRFQRGWVEAQVSRIGETAAVALFRSNYEQLQA